MSSSPPSSPPCIDSSPPSSPGLDPAVWDPEPSSLNLSHPFAASAKANRIPPQYEKKRTTDPPVTPYRSKKPRRQYRQLGPQEDFDSDDSLDFLDTPSRVNIPTEPSTPVQTLEQREAATWDHAITRVIDDGNGSVHLDNQGLTYIPAKIADLAAFFTPAENVERVNRTTGPPIVNSPPRIPPGGRMFTRIFTAPVGESAFFGSSRSLGERTRTIPDMSLGIPKEDLALFLGLNKISSLPWQIFSLQRLTLLSLRNNMLTYLPPEISRLTGLHTLNIAGNKIQYLPAEMLNMKLKKLQLHPNPFITVPVSRDEDQNSFLCGVDGCCRRFANLNSLKYHYINAGDHGVTGLKLLSSGEHKCLVGKRKPVSPTLHILPQVPPLTELCLRILFSSSPTPYPSSNTPQSCVLSSQYEMPLYKNPYDYMSSPNQEGYNPIPLHLREVMDACVPGSIDADDLPSNDGHTSENSRISGIGVCPSPSHILTGKNVFAYHAEERYTWETVIAGVEIGGSVPVKWRGCQWGCLAFLGDEEYVKEASDAEKTDREDEDEEMEVESEIVQVVEFSAIGLGEEDFED